MPTRQRTGHGLRHELQVLTLAGFLAQNDSACFVASDDMGSMLAEVDTPSYRGHRCLLGAGTALRQNKEVDRTSSFWRNIRRFAIAFACVDDYRLLHA